MSEYYNNLNDELNIEDFAEYDCDNEEPSQQSHCTLPYRRHTKQKKLNKRYKIINYYGYAPHIGYMDDNNCYIKYPKNSKCQRWMKRHTSKRVRKTNLPSGNIYRRVFDYWWTLY